MTSHIPSPQAAETARILFDIQAVHFNTEKPFILTSGDASPTYVDCRKIISFPKARRALMTAGAKLLDAAVGNSNFDIVAGGETAGIPFGAWMAEIMDKPMVYIRKQPKGFGRGAQIEGVCEEGKRVLLVEDMARDGGSKLMFVEAARKAGAVCDHVFVNFYYDIFPEKKKILADMGITLHYLCTWWDMLAVARAENRFDAKTLDSVDAYLHDPQGWSAAHKGKTGT